MGGGDLEKVIRLKTGGVFNLYTESTRSSLMHSLCRMMRFFSSLNIEIGFRTAYSVGLLRTPN